jgi:hypothetical protein
MRELWSKDEEQQLIKEIINKKSYEEIGEIHNRSPNAILLRFNKLIYDNIQKKKSIKELSKIFKLNEDKIKQAYYDHKSFIEKKVLNKNIKEKDNNLKVSKDVKISKSSTNSDIEQLQKEILILKTKNKVLKDLVKKIYNRNKKLK